MASVWVPFTSESKEAIADYDEIRKEIKLALQECGRRLGVFLRRREHAKSEFRRRNIFELYIEEVVEACNRLKGGKLPKEKLKEQLQKIAAKRTGGQKTDEALGRNGGPEGLPFSIIVTPDGTEGDAPVIAGDERSELAAPEEAREDEPLVGAVELDNSTESLAKVKKKTTKQKQSASISGSLPKTKAGSKTPATGSKHSNREIHGTQKRKKS
jgi:DNA topoisomerase-6 subunit B